MTDLLVRKHAPDAAGVVLEVTPKSAGWSHVGFKVVELGAGRTATGGETGRETCLVVLSGTADIAVGKARFDGLGGRASVFEDKAPGAVYAPGGAAWTVTATTPVELAVCTAPATGAGAPRVIQADRMSREVRGQGTNTRHVRNILPETEPAESLLVVEVITPGGNWSSYPPHKHDVSNLPLEADLEEIYYYRIAPPDGFGLQRLYTPDGRIDQAYVIHDGDLLLVPEGYHVFAVAQGYTGYYLNILAGNEPVRTMQPSDDPTYAWVRKTWTPDLNERATSWREIDRRVNRGAGVRD